MADTTPLQPGLKTSEGALAIAAVVLGTALESVGTFLTHEHALHPTQFGWSVAVILCGVLLQSAIGFGYIKGRNALKYQALTTALQDGLPIAEKVVEAIVDKGPTTIPPSPVAPATHPYFTPPPPK